MNLNYLHYFNILGQMQHYGKASEYLHITQPGLSQTITKLEDELGVILFEKKGRNVVLTKMGYQYWKRVNYALKELELARTELIQSASGESGRVDIGFTFTLGSVFIPNLMKDFLEIPNNHGITLTTLQGDSPEIIRAIKERKCDIGFCAYFSNEPDLKFVPIFRQKLILIVSKGHPLIKKEAIQCEDLIQYPFISFKKSHALHNKINQIFESHSLSIQPSYEVTEDTAMAGLVSSNLGIAIIPDSPILDFFPIQKLHVLNAPANRHLYMCYLENHYQSPAVRAFLQFSLDRKQLS